MSNHQINIFGQRLIDKLKAFEIKPNKKLGQHFLVNESFIKILTQSIKPSSTIIEVGPGPGQLTKAIAKKARRVISIEIDLQYEPILSDITDHYPNIQTIFADAISLNWQKLIKNKKNIQIIASLPYHITEPFLHKVKKLPVDDITLIVGNKLGKAIKAKNENDPNFSQRTLLVHTFFHSKILGGIEKQSFFPVPRTNSVIVKLIPKTGDQINSTRHGFMFNRLFLSTTHGKLLKNCLRESLIKYSPEKLTQNQAKDIINNLKISNSTLNKSFDQLNNNELRKLSKTLR